MGWISWNGDCSSKGEKGRKSHAAGARIMKVRQLAVAAGFLLASSLAFANVQYTFYASGVTESYSQQGTAVFSFANDGSSLSITLNDTVVPTTAVLSSITGLQFGLLIGADRHDPHLGHRDPGGRLHQFPEPLPSRQRIVTLWMGSDAEWRRDLPGRGLRWQRVRLPALRNRQRQLFFARRSRRPRRSREQSSVGRPGDVQFRADGLARTRPR